MTNKKDSEQSAEKLVSATVAPRRTVDVAGEQYGPGEVVQLPATEVAILRKKGFLLAESAEKTEPGRVQIEHGGAGASITDPE